MAASAAAASVVRLIARVERSPHSSPARFVFWVNVPEQAGYPYRPGRSVNRYTRVLPHPPPKKPHKHRKPKKHRKSAE
jgi:hypothetical protein